MIWEHSDGVFTFYEMVEITGLTEHFIWLELESSSAYTCINEG